VLQDVSAKFRFTSYKLVESHILLRMKAFKLFLTSQLPSLHERPLGSWNKCEDTPLAFWLTGAPSVSPMNGRPGEWKSDSTSSVHCVFDPSSNQIIQNVPLLKKRLDEIPTYLSQRRICFAHPVAASPLPSEQELERHPHLLLDRERGMISVPK
jgi:hypothetical protein